MQRRFVIAAGSTAILLASVAACSEGSRSTESDVSTSASADGGEPRVSVEGEVQDLGGPVKCFTDDGRLNIVGGDAATQSGANDPNSRKGFVVVIEEGESPVVRYVSIQDAMRVAIIYDHQGSDSNGGDARVFIGGKTYKVSGHGVDKANQEQVVYKSFQIDVTCP